MALRRGFKAEARRLAAEVREELGIRTFQPLDPYALARLYGIEVLTLDEPWLPVRAVTHFTGPALESFSGALIQVGTGCVIVENHVHERTRRRSTVAHEMAHVLLEHEFDVLVAGGLSCRSGDDRHDRPRSTVEQEAAELSAELLLPSDAARTAAFRDWTDASVARYFRISERMARWRMNVTGARRIARRSRERPPCPVAVRA
ncbi:ImmA/IrrE family metallo-endopeptidase [Saccharomonospora cyanea]|uniref:Putative Zn peptidase n=1 Tax=Saccharomonospora cyanea NA-134 TaxID=882082 RepID=H5XD76_9PSEU|nr:ImmA/IrrE family metallo-endopeptidase [Saccharomonospora cyanea]EHR59156.1 putative Zn peptidase [Saccharomonospora cyanea NA-134]